MRRIGALVGIFGVVAALTAAAPAGSVTMNVIYGTDRNDRIVATPAADVIWAKSGNDLITDVGSNDVVWASSGNDTIRFGTGLIENAAVHGNVGHDKIEAIGSTAGVLASMINAGSGNDSIKVVGCLEVQGESGNDTYENSATSCGALLNTANLGNGHDKVKLGLMNTLLLGNGNDQGSVDFPLYVHSGSGNDKLQVIETNASSAMHLGTGHDEVTVQRGAGGAVFGSNGNEKISYVVASNVLVHGQSGNDTFTIESALGPNALFGDQNRDKARLGTGVGYSCSSVETVVNLAGARRSCS